MIAFRFTTPDDQSFSLWLFPIDRLNQKIHNESEQRLLSNPLPLDHNFKFSFHVALSQMNKRKPVENFFRNLVGERSRR